jgi:hypothetical protein
MTHSGHPSQTRYGGCHPNARLLTRHRHRLIVAAMLMVRTILVALIAISVAMVPFTGGAAASAKPVEMSMANQADTPCCPPDDCKGSIACAFKCFNFVAAMFPAANPLPCIVDGPPHSFADDTLHGYVSPPTHPPPI